LGTPTSRSVATIAIVGGNTRENLYGLFTAWLKSHL